MMTNLRRTLTALAIASALTLAGCNSGQDTSPAAPPAAAASQAPGSTSDALTADQVNVQVTLQGTPTLSADGQWIDVTVNLANNGKTTLTSKGAHPVHLGAHSADASGKVIVRDLPRADIPDIAPGSQAAVTIRLPVNAMLGNLAQILPVQEEIAWFDNWGTKPLIVGPFTSCASPTTGKVCDANGNPLATAAN
jgi:hypothetical protein